MDLNQVALKDDEHGKKTIERHKKEVNSLLTIKTNETNMDRCYCPRFCAGKNGEDLSIFNVGTMMRMIRKAPKDPIHHTIKWLEDIRRNRARLWREYLEILWEEKPAPILTGKTWEWLAEVLNPKNHENKEELDLRLFKLPALEGMADSEMESISNLAFQIKYQSTEIRATKDLILNREYNVLNNFSKEMTVSEEALYYKKR